MLMETINEHSEPSSVASNQENCPQKQQQQPFPHDDIFADLEEMKQHQRQRMLNSLNDMPARLRNALGKHPVENRPPEFCGIKSIMTQDSGTSSKFRVSVQPMAPQAEYGTKSSSSSSAAAEYSRSMFDSQQATETCESFVGTMKKTTASVMPSSSFFDSATNCGEFELPDMVDMGNKMRDQLPDALNSCIDSFDPSIPQKNELDRTSIVEEEAENEGDNLPPLPLETFQLFGKSPFTSSDEIEQVLKSKQENEGPPLISSRHQSMPLRPTYSPDVFFAENALERVSSVQILGGTPDRLLIEI